MTEKLNMRQRKFAEYYVQSGNTVQSALNAGYSENYANTNACKLLENDRVVEYIKELTDKAKDERILTAKDRQVILSGIAQSIEEETSDRIKAIDTLNKMTGEYLNKVEVQGNINNLFEGLTTEQLRKLADDG
jgi:phage terminase small subunit